MTWQVSPIFGQTTDQQLICFYDKPSTSIRYLWSLDSQVAMWQSSSIIYVTDKSLRVLDFVEDIL